MPHSESHCVHLIVVKYMVLDCGGGTVDITVHEYNGIFGTLKEIHKASGGPHGSTSVDKEFEMLLAKMFSAEFVERYKRKVQSGFTDLMASFESRKRSVRAAKFNYLNIQLPYSFIDLFRKTKGYTVGTAIQRYNSEHCKWSSQGMLRISYEMMYRLFLPAIQAIKNVISSVIRSPSVTSLEYIFLVGGFADSPILQESIRDSFGHASNVVIPLDCSLATLKGAVLYGLDPSVINVRRSRFTYGVGVMHRFKPSRHPPEKRVTKGGRTWCADIFDKYVTIDQSVGIGDVVIRRYTPASSEQRKGVIHFYCSECDTSRFISDAEVYRIGTLILEFPESTTNTASTHSIDIAGRREIQTRMVFGDTEIKVSALDVRTGQYVKAVIDFLNF